MELRFYRTRYRKIAFRQLSDLASHEHRDLIGWASRTNASMD
jgi:hypothetical protein